MFVQTSHSVLLLYEQMCSCKAFYLQQNYDVRMSDHLMNARFSLHVLQHVRVLPCFLLVNHLNGHLQHMHTKKQAHKHTIALMMFLEHPLLFSPIWQTTSSHKQNQTFTREWRSNGEGNGCSLRSSWMNVYPRFSANDRCPMVVASEG